MASEPNDGTIVAAILAGESQRFDELARRYWAPLWRTARSRLNCDSAADDAVQETLVSAFRWLRSYNSQYSFRTWLWTILLNVCRRSLGQALRRREVSAEDREASDRLLALRERQPGPPDLALLQERAETLEQLLRQLPEAHADALRLRFYGGLRFPEIAEILGCSLSTVKNRIRAGLLQMADWLGTDDTPIPTLDEQQSP